MEQQGSNSHILPAAKRILDWLWDSNSRSGEPITSPYIAFLGMVGGMILALILVLLDVKSSIWWGSALASLFFGILVHFVWVWNKTVKLSKLGKTILLSAVGIGYFWLVGRQVLEKYHQERIPRVSLERQQKQIEQMTLHDFFKTDFVCWIKLPVSLIHDVDPKEGVKTVEGQLYQNLESNASFIGYYIPDDLHTYDHY